jgi:hypothetical protein
MTDPLSPLTARPSLDPSEGWIARHLPRAKFKQSDLGFRVGGVGMRLISKSVAVDTHAVGRAILDGRHRKMHLQFSQEMDVAMTRLCLLDAQNRGESSPPIYGSPGRGLRAYLDQLSSTQPRQSEDGFSAIV